MWTYTPEHNDAPAPRYPKRMVGQGGNNCDTRNGYGQLDCDSNDVYTLFYQILFLTGMYTLISVVLPAELMPDPFEPRVYSVSANHRLMGTWHQLML